MPATPFAAFLLHRHSSRAEDLPLRASGYSSMRDESGGRGRLGR